MGSVGALSISGANIAVGGLEVPVADIERVNLAFRAPRRFFYLCILGLTVFVLTGSLMLLEGITEIFRSNQASPISSSQVGLVFWVGTLSYLGIFVLATVTSPPQWQVVLKTQKGDRIIYADRSRKAASIYANRTKDLVKRVRPTV